MHMQFHVIFAEEQTLFPPFFFFTSLFSIHYVIVRDGCSIIQLS